MLSAGDSNVIVQQSSWFVVQAEKGRIGFSSSSVSDSIIMESRSNELTLVVDCNPTDTSNIRVVVDNGVVDTVLNNYFRVEHQLLPQIFTSNNRGPHTVKIVHLGPGTFVIDYVLYAQYPAL